MHWCRPGQPLPSCIWDGMAMHRPQLNLSIAYQIPSSSGHLTLPLVIHTALQDGSSPQFAFFRSFWKQGDKAAPTGFWLRRGERPNVRSPSSSPAQFTSLALILAFLFSLGREWQECFLLAQQVLLLSSPLPRAPVLQPLFQGPAPGVRSFVCGEAGQRQGWSQREGVGADTKGMEAGHMYLLIYYFTFRGLRVPQLPSCVLVPSVIPLNPSCTYVDWERGKKKTQPKSWELWFPQGPYWGW